VLASTALFAPRPVFPMHRNEPCYEVSGFDVPVRDQPTPTVFAVLLTLCVANQLRTMIATTNGCRCRRIRPRIRPVVAVATATRGAPACADAHGRRRRRLGVGWLDERPRARRLLGRGLRLHGVAGALRLLLVREGRLEERQADAPAGGRREPPKSSSAVPTHVAPPYNWSSTTSTRRTTSRSRSCTGSSQGAKPIAEDIVIVVDPDCMFLKPFAMQELVLRGQADGDEGALLVRLPLPRPLHCRALQPARQLHVHASRTRSPCRC
jgi:hypothetical protein